MTQNEIEKALGKVIDEKITPRLKRLEEKSDATMEAAAETKVEVTILKEKVDDMGYTEERIETKLDSTTRRQDDFSVKADQLNRRVLKLESKRT